MTFDRDQFAKPPHRLAPDNAQEPARMTMVLFERPDCNPCRRFHQRVLADAQVQALMAGYHTVQLDATDDTSEIVVPDGRTLTSKTWSEELRLNYDIAVVFFDEQGKEVHRLDAETGRDRMTGSLQYVRDKAYQRHQQFLRWRKEQVLERP